MNLQTAHRIATVQEYYFSQKLREVHALRMAGKPIINLGIGSPDLQPPQEVLKALQGSLSDPKAHQYQSYQGLPEFREAIAHFYKKHYDVTLDPSQEIIPLMGSKEGIMHISMAFLNKGDQVLIPNPGYPTYTSVTHLVEAEPLYYSLDMSGGWLPNLQELSEQDLSRVKLMWINYPHMPTGATASLEDLKALVLFCKEHEILLVNDNPYSFVLNESPLSLLTQQLNFSGLLELNSCSKTFNMAGWRVGMLVGDREALKAVLRVKTQMDSGMFYGVQQGAIAALQTPSSWLEEQNTIYAKRRELVWQLADALGCEYQKNSVGLFVWASVPKGKSATELTDTLLYEKDIFITPGMVFGSQGEGYIRFSLCVPEATIKEALKRV